MSLLSTSLLLTRLLLTRLLWRQRRPLPPRRLGQELPRAGRAGRWARPARQVRGHWSRAGDRASDLEQLCFLALDELVDAVRVLLGQAVELPLAASTVVL